MGSKRDELLEAYENLLKVRGECACEIMNECAVSNLTVKQIEYLKIIDRNNDVTFSKLAEITRNSKPTITEMINKFINFDCVFKKKSLDDGRVSFIRLTDQGERIARAEQITILKVVDRMIHSLSENEIEILITIFKKVK
ncbi:MAG: winged helix-turn-helix transcriptional regulator [bacterium]|nr:winged helix-turn-helix transcriptional regulator [bacterium]